MWKALFVTSKEGWSFHGPAVSLHSVPCTLETVLEDTLGKLGSAVKGPIYNRPCVGARLCVRVVSPKDAAACGICIVVSIATVVLVPPQREGH